ncbi:transporter [Tetragenococcus halophilus subsp. flandriensis]|uniref:Na/Pi cotransporter family protein n=1 Tax=Tetragenococcus halophilus TaxID=51669 RepID=UPI0023E932E9|nr:Na/Pi cotransporter family protein [Tetragenococcus halophilus]GMA08326.1 transporter [Tetragenococcus halophilus subsp. flandriensis]
MDAQQIIFQFIGGIGIFLFGLKYMGDGLQRAAGDNLRNILNAFTSTPLRAVLAGATVTALIQSSSGTTVLTVGLVSAGFMSLTQAIGVIMGANVGTTITAFVIGLNISDYALPIIGAGALFLFFFKNQLITSIGQIIFGFGALFYGLDLMGSGLEPLQNLQTFSDLMLWLSDNSFLGIITGSVMTLILQSSSATTGILQQLFSQDALTIEAALPILFGTNIGTTFTSVLAAVGASLAAKRTALAHVIFNVFGTVFAMLLFAPFTMVLNSLTATFSLNPELQIAFAHGLFNLLSVGLLIWFTPQLARLVSKIIPGEEDTIEMYEPNLDYSLVQRSPVIALDQTKHEIIQLGQFVLEEYNTMFDYYRKQDKKSYDHVLKIEDVVDRIDLQITEYLMYISGEDLPARNSNEHAQMGEIGKYLERIGDHTENILKNIEEVNAADKLQKKNGNSERNMLYNENLIELFNLVKQNIEEAMQAYETESHSIAGKVIMREKDVNSLEESIRREYISNLNKGIGKPSDGILFVDIVSNLERISDHSVKIAKHSLGIKQPFSKRIINKKGEEFVKV